MKGRTKIKRRTRKIKRRTRKMRGGSADLISVVIPTYNRFKYLLESIKSIRSQTYPNIEIIVVNDKSTQQEYYSYDFGSDVKIINLEKNSKEIYGYACAAHVRNEGIKASKGVWIAFCDDDDIWLPKKLELQVAALKSSGCKMSSTDGYIGDGTYRPNATYKLFNAEFHFPKIQENFRERGSDLLAKGFPKTWNAEFLEIHNCVITSSVVIAKEVLDTIGNFREFKPPGEDYDCWKRALKHTDLVYVEEPCFYYDNGHGDGQQYGGGTPLTEYTIYTLWTGKNEMSKDRKECFEELKRISECNVILITPDNLPNHIKSEHPLHEAYQYLSETHKADYLRTYLMNFYGGGYSDIKKTTGSWKSSFDNLSNSDKWICGYKEIEGGVAYEPLKDKWKELIGNGAYICKPNTPLTNEWYNEMIKLLNTKLEKLKVNSAKFPQDSAEKGTGYPIGWNEILGRIFHRLIHKYKDYVMNTLPISIFENYRGGGHSKGIIINLGRGQGGLGNQLFIYAAGYVFKNKMKMPLYILPIKDNPHTSFDYRSLFKGGIPVEESEMGERLNHAIKIHEDIQTEPYTDFTKSKNIQIDNMNDILLKGIYYQNYSPIVSVIPQIRREMAEVFHRLYPDYSKKAFESTSQNLTIFMHVRKGDYKDNALPTSYYNDAINIVNTLPNIKTLYILSDDVPFCEKQIKEKVWNPKAEVRWIDDPKDEIKTMYLMSLCKRGAIISASTFSSWGAILGADETNDSVIIYPENWGKYDGNVMGFPEQVGNKWRPLTIPVSVH